MFVFKNINLSQQHEQEAHKPHTHRYGRTPFAIRLSPSVSLDGPDGTNERTTLYSKSGGAQSTIDPTNTRTMTWHTQAHMYAVNLAWRNRSLPKP